MHHFWFQNDSFVVKENIFENPLKNVGLLIYVYIQKIKVRY